jgi:hypothetical protein
MVQMYKKIVNTQSVIWYGKTNKQFISLSLPFADQGKQTSFTQTKVCCFRFPFAANKWKLPFSVNSVFCLLNFGNMETLTWRHGDTEMETCKQGYIDVRHGNMEKWRHGDV